MQNKNLLASILFFTSGLASMAQTPPPPMPPPPPGLPIDSSIIFLFVVALIYGVYKSHKASRETA